MRIERSRGAEVASYPAFKYDLMVGVNQGHDLVIDEWIFFKEAAVRILLHIAIYICIDAEDIFCNRQSEMHFRIQVIERFIIIFSCKVQPCSKMKMVGIQLNFWRNGKDISARIGIQ